MQHLTSAGRRSHYGGFVQSRKTGHRSHGKAGDFAHGVIAAREAGARNVEAEEQHNVAIKRNPSLAARGAAIPRENSGHANANQQHSAQEGAGRSAQPHGGRYSHMAGKHVPKPGPKGRAPHEEGGENGREPAGQGQDERR